MIEVLAPGFQTTVQDAGRHGYGELGVSAAGAADDVAMRIANRLVGNPDGAPVLEMTLSGGRFGFAAPALVALAGSDFGPVVDGSELPMWRSVEVAAGQVLSLGATREGARCTMAVRGGIDVPRVLGSASTHLVTSIGGVEGRALREGDVLPVGPPPHGVPRERTLDPERLPWVRARDAVRVTAGPQAGWFPPEAHRTLGEARWRVHEGSDRVGLRLEGKPLTRHRRGELLTEGAPIGAVQVTAEGMPIVLFVDHQTTGGYPKIANVVAADLHVLGQLRPRDRVRLMPVSLHRAHAILREQEEALDSVLG